MIVISGHAKGEMGKSSITESEVRACLAHGELVIKQIGELPLAFARGFLFQ